MWDGLAAFRPRAERSSEQKEDRLEKPCSSRHRTQETECVLAVTQVKNGASRRSVVLLDPELVWEGGGGVKSVTGVWFVELRMPEDHPSGKKITRQ